MQAGLLGIEELDRRDIEAILARAKVFQPLQTQPTKKLDTLRGKLVVLLFFEASTRTRTSFAIAAKRLGADTVAITASGSSVSKGESLVDTLNTLAAMRPDAIVMRHSASGAPHFLQRHLETPIINAGDGTHEHPTQALLDAFTIRKHKGGFDGLTVAICGDILHSRVARSNAALLTTLGARVRFAAPHTLMPSHCETLGVEVYDRLEPALEGADVVMMLRVQRERLSGVFLPSMREYSRTFGLSKARLALAKPDAIVMHPGPMNRGVEISPEVADGAQSVILDQVEAGVAVRMAVLYTYSAERVG
jgi:aspartate carbamoyltransferase catalytic subunit